MHLHETVDLDQVALRLPKNFTGADFGALSSEAYMIAVHRRIHSLEVEINDYKQKNGIAEEDELLPETYFKLKFGDVG